MRNVLVAVMAVSFLGTAFLTGCGGMGSFPDSGDALTTPIGAIRGVNMGGHAPLAGAHIYLLEAGNGGYGSVVKSLITSTATGAIQNGSWTNSGYTSDLFVPSVDASGNPIYGLVANGLGAFNLTGDYSCDVGRVVYVVGVGGNPGLSGTAVSVTSAQVTALSGTGATERATVTLTFSSSPGYSAGSNLSFSGFSGTFQTGTGINGTTSVMASASGATASVSIPEPSGAVAVGTYTVSGTATPSYFNHAAVNMAILGKCPSTGTFSSVLPYILMNEVSSVAAAYVFQPYVATSGSNQTGIDEFHIGSSSSALGLQGIQLAGGNAANLYDITNTNAATVNLGIALPFLPSNGGAPVPQAELDTLGNILAACVDSGNTYRAGIGTLQASCQSLFQYASSNGVYDTSAGNTWTLSTSTDAFNTFQAMLNITRFVQGAGVGSTTSGTQTVTTAFSSTTAASFTSAIYGLESGTVPFTPNLHSTSAGTPQNFSAYINIQGVSANGLAIDASGNLWAANGASGVTEMSLGGAILLNLSGNGLNVATGIAIDGSGNAWISNKGGNSLSEFSKTGAALRNPTGNGLNTPLNVAIDASNNVWVSNQIGNSVSKFSNAGAALLDLTGNGLSGPHGIAIDGSGNAWVGNQNSSAVSVFSSAGAASLDLTTGLNQVTGVSLDSAGNAWVTNFNGNSLSKFSNAGAVLVSPTGNGLSSPFDTAIDGSGGIWIGNGAGNGLSRFSSAGVALVDITQSELASAYSIAIDGSGNVWVGNANDGSVNEFIGIAPPVITPIVAGLPATPTGNGSSSLGTRP